MHYYQFNIADYRKDTYHLTPIEHYIYRTLIDWYYLDEQPIPKITQVVSRRLGLGSDMEPNISNVLKDFFIERENGWHHRRIDDEINEYHSQCDKNKTNGKLGGRPKKTQVVTSGNPELTDSNPVVTLTTNHKPLTTKEKRKSKEITLSEFLDDCKTRGEKAIREDDPIFDWAKKIALPEDMLYLGWNEFKNKQASDKKQADWRATFRVYVKSDYLKLWTLNRDGEYYLTLRGKQLERELNGAPA